MKGYLKNRWYTLFLVLLLLIGIPMQALAKVQEYPQDIQMNTLEETDVETEELEETESQVKEETKETAVAESKEPETASVEETEETKSEETSLEDETEVESEVKAEPSKASRISGSIAGVIQTGDESKIIVIGDGVYSAHAATPAGLREALYFMYNRNDQADYVLYIGSNLDLTSIANRTVMAKTIPATPSNANMTFYALQGRIGTLVITGTKDDPINNSNTGIVTGSSNINGYDPQDWHFGTDVELRNIRYDARSLYANGNKLSLMGGSYHTRILNVYGGTDSGTLTGNPNLEIYSTGTGGTMVVGGNYSGTLNGNITTNVYNTSGKITTFAGGNYSGTVNGNITTTIYGMTGDLDNFYGSGVGASTTAKSHVNGSVTSTIKGINGSLGAFYGGTKYGDVSLFIKSSISGPGKHGSGTFYGGCGYGDIGFGNASQVDVIINEIDFSQYGSSTTARHYVGANANSGTITGNIVNVVTAGDFGAGYLNGFNGGGGSGTMGGASASREDSKNNADFKVFGNITSTVKQGCIGSNAGLVLANDKNYARGAGYGGYIEGDVLMHLGTTGLVYGSDDHTSTSDVPYEVNLSTGTQRNGRGHGYKTSLDIFGGGGNAADANIYVYGNTHVIQENVIARWTYGGTYWGYIEGNTTNELRGGIVDTLEGTGYFGERVVGDSHSIVKGGQVDWFLSGGGWNDTLQIGNAKVTIYDGIINANVGGTYGYAIGHKVQGDAEINIYGGDFRGHAHEGTTNPSVPKTIAGGPSSKGTITGNITVNIDYSNNTKGQTFELPKGCNLSGGVPYGVATGVSVGETTTETSITVNIKAGGDGSADALAGASIYGDGGTNLDNCKAEHIIMNIDAPGSSIGELYATNAKHDLKKNVEVNVWAAKSIEAINGGSGRSTSLDNFTNTIVSNAASTSKGKNQAIINVGQKDLERFVLEIGSGGIKNYTQLTIDNADFFSQGNVLNGAGVTLANYGTTYHQFGDIYLKNNSGFGIAATAYAAGGKMTLEGEESRLTSPSGRGKIMINDFQPNESRVSWIRNGGDGMYSHIGTWFSGPHDYYRVLTFLPTGNYGNAINVTPANFRGTEQSNGKTYIGDNSTTDGYALALPGSFIEYKVEKEKGHITHNVDNVSTGPAPITVYGTVAKDTPAQEGILAIPAYLNLLPTLTFTPDADNGYWVEQVTIDKSDDTQEVKGTRADYEAETWTSPNGEFSYFAKAYYTNEAELEAYNIILTESEAQAIETADDIIALQKAKGRPFFGHNITQELIDEINKPLGEGVPYRDHDVTYRAGVVSDPINNITITAKVIIVPDDAIFPQDPDDRSAAIIAFDSTMTVDEANALADYKELNEKHTKPLVIFSDGTTAEPDISAGAFDAINQATAPTEVDVTYSYTKENESTVYLETTVKVTIIDDYVCKIGDVGYKTLEEAIEAANAKGANGEPAVVIQMLIDDYELTKPVTITHDITITTASKTDATLPYQGNNDQARIYLADELNDSKALMTIESNGYLRLDNIALDGNGANFTANQPLINNANGGLEIKSQAIIEDFNGTQPMIVNGATAIETVINGGTIINNKTTSNNGLIENNSTLTINGGVVKDNKVGNGGAIYQNGQMNVSGNVQITGNVNGTQPNNVYLPKTSTERPLEKVITVVGDLDASSIIGVMTETTPNATDKGTKYTIIAVAGSGYSNLDQMQPMFKHDQLSVNADAYEIIKDLRPGGTDLVLGGVGEVPFKFIKVDASDTTVTLPGAEFKLYTCNNQDPAHVHEETVSDEIISDSNCWVSHSNEQGQPMIVVSDDQGVVDLGELQDGAYMLVETKAPTGYEKPLGQWLIEVDSAKATANERISITAKGDVMPPAFMSQVISDNQVDYRLPNMTKLLMPTSGHEGILKIVLLGSLLMLLSTMLFILNKRKNINANKKIY